MNYTIQWKHKHSDKWSVYESCDDMCTGLSRIGQLRHVYPGHQWRIGGADSQITRLRQAH